MTRVNNINPVDLTNEWLISECRELPRVTNELIFHPNRFCSTPDDTPYTLNTGHVKQFRNKILYLAKRHLQIKKEMKRRGLKINPHWRVRRDQFVGVIREQGMQDWKPTQADQLVNIERLMERWDLRGKAHHITGLDGIVTTIDNEQAFNDYLNKYLGKYF